MLELEIFLPLLTEYWDLGKGHQSHPAMYSLA